MNLPVKVSRKSATLLLLLACAVVGCTFFSDVKTVVHKLAHTGEGGGGGKGSGKGAGGEQKQPEPSREGSLLDNKVTALRIQEALKKAGPEFDQVQVTGTKEAVVMTGSVKTPAERLKAEELAKSVHRSMRLTNEIKVGK